jgi:hypothetical protein
MRKLAIAMLMSAFLEPVSADGTSTVEHDIFAAHPRIVVASPEGSEITDVASTADFVRHFPVGREDWKCHIQLTGNGDGILVLHCPGYGSPRERLRMVFRKRGDDLAIEAVQAGADDLDATRLAAFAKKPFATFPTLQSLLSDADAQIRLEDSAGTGRVGKLSDGIARLRREGYDCTILAGDDDMATLSCLYLGDGADPRSFDYVIRMKTLGRVDVVDGGSRLDQGTRKPFPRSRLEIHFRTWF